MPRKRGRPVNKDSRSRKFNIRLTPDEDIMLDFLSDKLQMSKSDIIRKGLMMQYRMHNI